MQLGSAGFFGMVLVTVRRPETCMQLGRNSDVASRQTASLAARVPSTDDKLGRTQGVVRHGRVPLSER